MQKRKISQILIVSILGLFLINFVSAFGYDTDDIVNSPFGYDTEDHLEFEESYISTHTNNTIVVTSSGVWMNVTFDNEESTLKKRITHTFNDSTNYTFIIIDSGVYEITYTLTFEDGAASPSANIVTRVTSNNIELNGFTIERDSSKQYHDFGISHSDLAKLNSGDEIGLSFTSDDTTVSLESHLTFGEHPSTGHFTIKRIYE